MTRDTIRRMAKVVPTKLYQLRVTLLGTKPPIWRRLLVPGDLRLDQLHEVIQIAMPWTNSHLHQFIAKAAYKPTREEVDKRAREEDWYDAAWADGLRYISHPSFELDSAEDETELRLDQLAPERRTKFVYEYDKGDSWQHQILVEKIIDSDPGTTSHPHCLDGALACPPDDCGGIWGYYDMLDAIRNDEHEAHDDMLEWLGIDDPDEFDPGLFDIDAVNRELGEMKFGRRRRRG